MPRVKKDEIFEVAKAKATLKKYGYYTDNLWSAFDVTSQFKCTKKQGTEIIKAVMNSDFIKQTINEDIADRCANAGYEERY